MAKKVTLVTCECADVFETKDNPWGFIASKGMLDEYVKEVGKRGWRGYDRKRDHIDKSKMMNSLENVHIINDGDQVYYYGYKDLGPKKMFEIYSEDPSIFNDDNFTWKVNKKYGSKEAIIDSTVFTFNCIVKTNGDAFVDVKYNKKSNYHRNNVTIARIDIPDADNTSILKAIDKWKNDFIRDIV